MNDENRYKQNPSSMDSTLLLSQDVWIPGEELPPQGIGPETKQLDDGLIWGVRVRDQGVEGTLVVQHGRLKGKLIIHDPSAYYKMGEIRGLRNYDIHEGFYKLDVDPRITITLDLNEKIEENSALKNAGYFETSLEKFLDKMFAKYQCDRLTPSTELMDEQKGVEHADR